MPQMAPLMWSLLFLSTTICFLAVCTLLYFNTHPSHPTNTHPLSLSSLLWKW